MRFDNSAVHARSESEVVRVDDEPPQAVSLAGGEKAACTFESSRRGWAARNSEARRLTSFSAATYTQQRRGSRVDATHLISTARLSGRAKA
jgi:hypothetical protein